MKYKRFITFFTRTLNGHHIGGKIVILFNEVSNIKCGFLASVLPGGQVVYGQG
jgi:hypothetical protein